jgi:hypothetical protein
VSEARNAITDDGEEMKLAGFLEDIKENPKRDTTVESHP